MHGRVAPLLLRTHGDRRRAARDGVGPVSGPSVRCFIAVRLPDQVRASLAAVCAELRGQTRGLSWVREDNLHLTLRFLGEVEPVTLERVREAVTAAAAGVAPFTVSLGGLGGFPPGRSPRVLWAGVAAGAEEIMALHAALETALAARSVPKESRAFHPHVTVARARDPRGAGGLRSALGTGPVFGEARVTALHLMRSELDPRGARHSVLMEARLVHRSGVG
jgi:RNA 2',3'-cyclic 3'-phosphodiesterase